MVNQSKQKTVEESKEPEGGYPLLKVARKVLLAAIGAVALAQDEIEDFINKLVDRGEIAEKDGKRLLKEIMEKRADQKGRLEEQLNKRIEQMFIKLNIPTKSDIESMNSRIAELTKKIEELTESKT